MKNPKLLKAKNAIKLIHEAVGIRSQITELYVRYRSLSSLACQAGILAHNDLKRAVDAIHYLGGGWPTEKSKGRMEAMLDNFVGMYRILDFIGSGELVTKHLAKQGITVTLADKFKIEDVELTPNEIKYIVSEFSGLISNADKLTTVRELVTAVVLECEVLQGEICQLADQIKDNLRPAAMKELDIENPEFDRLFDLAKTKSKDTPRASESIFKKKTKTNESVSGYNVATSVL